MNFTPELSALQGALLSADNVHKFSNLSAKGGNEDEINNVISNLTTFLQQGMYLVDGKVPVSKVDQVRKFALYIVFNSDLPELGQLVESDEISTLIWTTPTIPKCLMCELLWNLHMERFISEIISYCQPQLALEVAGAFLDHLKYADPLECLEQLRLLSSACYTLISRLHIYNFKSQDLNKKSTDAFNNFKRCLKYYTTPPNNEKLNSLQQIELYRYQGRSLYSLFQLMDECLTRFTSKIDLNEDKSGLYKLTYEEGSLRTGEPLFLVNESADYYLSESLNNANTAMLDICKVLVMDVSVDVFCYWSEFEEGGRSMQQTIGELCYKVHNKVTALASLAEHPLVSMLNQIARKPVEMKDIINLTSDKEILFKIGNNNEESKAWIKGLIYTEKINECIDLLLIVDSNIDTYDSDECFQLYSVLKTGTQDLIDLVAVKAFQKCDLSKKYQILETRFANKTLTDMKEAAHFKSTMTSVFNKYIISQESDLTDVLTLFLQNPREVFMKMFSLASENVQQMQIMLNVLKLLESFRDHYYSMDTESCLIQSAQKTFDVLHTEVQENNYIQFITTLKNTDVIPKTKLLLLIIMPNLHKALLKRNIHFINVQLRLLRAAYSQQELVEYRAPILAMLAQVMDIVRWKINTFTPNAPATLEWAVEIVTSLFNTYNDVIPDNEKQWLKSQLKHSNPLTQYYYRSLWEPPGTNYLEVVGGFTVSEETTLDVLTTRLAQVFCSCTQQEWCEIWDSLIVFPSTKSLNIVHLALRRVAAAERNHRTDKTAACMLYCCRNYVYLVRYKYMMEPLFDLKVELIIKKIAAFTEWIDESYIEELKNIVMPLFAYLTEKQGEFDVNLAECLKTHFENTKLAGLINRVFINGST